MRPHHAAGKPEPLQSPHSNVLESRDEQLVGENPEAHQEVEQARHFLDAEVELLAVQPLHEKRERASVHVVALVRLRPALDQVAVVEHAVQHGRVVARELFVDDELLRLLVHGCTAYQEGDEGVRAAAGEEGWSVMLYLESFCERRLEGKHGT